VNADVVRLSKELCFIELLLLIKTEQTDLQVTRSVLSWKCLSFAESPTLFACCKLHGAGRLCVGHARAPSRGDSEEIKS